MFLLFKKERKAEEGIVDVSPELEPYPPEEPRAPGPAPSPSMVPQTTLDKVPPHLQTQAQPQQQTPPLFSPQPMAPQPEGKIQLKKPPQNERTPARLQPGRLIDSNPALPPAKEN